MRAPAHIVSMSVPEWRALTLNGAMIPVRIPLRGDSMRPLIRRERDLVTIVPLARPLKRGDVVLFARCDGRYVVHRVYALRENAVRTLGDGCRQPDAWMPRESVYGLAAGFERDGRAFSLDTPFSRAWGRAWMASLPVRGFYLRARHIGGKILRGLGLRKTNAPHS